jgi:hypothetical protein
MGGNGSCMARHLEETGQGTTALGASPTSLHSAPTEISRPISERGDAGLSRNGSVAR